MKKYYGVLLRVRELEQKNGVSYAKPDGRLYKALRFLYSAAGAYTFVINLFFVLGLLLVYSGTDNMTKVKASIITASACTGVMIIGYVLNCLRLYLAGGITSVIPIVLLLPFFGNILQDDFGFLGFKTSYYWRHFIPLVLMIFFMVWLTVIAVRANIKTDRLYKRVTENLYNMYSISDDMHSELTDEQWEEFLISYNPADYKNPKKTKKVQAISEEQAP
ncbi:MAG: hypothetical protein IKD04_07945 [Clostridia bacterium]|nr:hypothetical protein [Clostridia bacterium]